MAKGGRASRVHPSESDHESDGENMAQSAEMRATAWGHLMQGNSMEFERHVRDQQYYQRKQMTKAQISQFTGIFQSPASWPQGVGTSHQTPVFIIGMMRSGSTLLEQILSTHSMVFGAGEDSVFGSHVDQIIEAVVNGVRSGSVAALQGVEGVALVEGWRAREMLLFE